LGQVSSIDLHTKAKFKSPEAHHILLEITGLHHFTNSLSKADDDNMSTWSDELTAEVYSASVRARSGSYMGACLVFSSEQKGTSKNENAIKCTVHDTHKRENDYLNY
jgi:hypothetical protein